jgi:hypothetical protein
MGQDPSSLGADPCPLPRLIYPTLLLLLGTCHGIALSYINRLELEQQEVIQDTLPSLWCMCLFPRGSCSGHAPPRIYTCPDQDHTQHGPTSDPARTGWRGGLIS